MTPPIKVLYVITDSGVGGSEKVLTYLLEGFEKNNCQPVGIVVLKTLRQLGQYWKSKGFPVFELGMKKIPHLGHIEKLKKIISNLKPDFVHSFLYHAVQIGRLSVLGNPAVKFISSPRVNYRFAPMWARLFDRMMSFRDNLAICESSATAKTLIHSMGYKKEKVTVIPNGVDAARFTFKESSRERIRAQWKINNQEFVIGGVGRLTEQKGFDIFINALSKIKMSGLHAVLVGEGRDEEKLKKLASSISIPVSFIGNQTKMEDIYSGFDMYVQSSRFEGMSNSLLEAMSMGLPIVATSVDGTIDVADDGLNMRLVPPDDPNQLSEKIIDLIMHDEARSTLGKNARSKALTMTLENTRQQFQNCYNQLYTTG